MSLAMYAADYSNDNSNISTIQKKRIAHTKTQKQYPKTDFNVDKVNSMLNKIHGNISDDSNELGDYTPSFTPPPMPESAGVEKTLSDDNLELNNLKHTYGDADEIYTRTIPHYNKPIHTTNMNQSDIERKLNYMISLLEEQQDERTNNVTEEVVLYSFLGIFVIFVVDSFVKVGKYVR